MVQVICDVQRHSRHAHTARCRCHPKIAFTGHPRWVRIALIDYHTGLLGAVMPSV